jgi:hypothetical protein
MSIFAGENKVFSLEWHCRLLRKDLGSSTAVSHNILEFFVRELF